MLSVLIATLTSTALADMNCNAEKVESCTNCKTNIAVSCAQDSHKGFVAKNTTPSKLMLSVTNEKTGTVRFVEVPNSKTLESLTNSKDLKNDSEIVEEVKKKKIKVSDRTKIDLVHFQMKDSTVVYKDTAMNTAITLNKTALKKQSRMVASEAPADTAGGVSRAEKADAAE